MQFALEKMEGRHVNECCKGGSFLSYDNTICVTLWKAKKMLRPELDFSQSVHSKHSIFSVHSLFARVQTVDINFNQKHAQIEAIDNTR